MGSALSLWLKDYELSRSTIGWAGLIFSVYAINFIWAPIIDRVKIPFLTQKIGHRKSWIISLQAIILVCLFIWTTLNPITNLELIILLGLLIAISSASQDITIDALRIEQIGENEKASMAAGASIAVVGWWTGYKIGGMLTLFVADYFEQQGLANYWQLTFLFICLIIFLFNIGLLFIPEDLSNKRQIAQKSDQDRLKLNKFSAWFVSTIVSPLISFFKKNGLTISLLIIGFIFLFKIGEAFLGGWFSIKSGVVRALFISGIAMAITNIMFSVMAWSEKSVLLFAAAVLLDDLAAAFATVAFVTFISLLVDRTYTATQYALLASLGTAGRTLMASSSGSLVDWLQGDWGVFFIITAVMVIPSLILLWFIRNKFSFN